MGHQLDSTIRYPFQIMVYDQEGLVIRILGCANRRKAAFAFKREWEVWQEHPGYAVALYAIHFTMIQSWKVGKL